MKAYFTRDSVAAGDDADAPHAREMELPDGISAEELVRTVCRNARLASIVGGRATWCLSSNVPLAVVAQQWAEPKLIGFPWRKMADLDVAGSVVRLHFSYFAQQDPDVVYAVLQRLTLRAQ